MIFLLGIVEKLADAKVKPAGFECLFCFSEATSPSFVLGVLFQNSSKHKNPKVVTEALLFVASSVEEFGSVGLQLKLLVDFIKECLEITNPGVKSQAVKTLGTMRKVMGPGLRDFVADVKSTVLATIDEEFSKVANEAAPGPKRTFKEAAQLSKVKKESNT